jgi:hypothetical protein
MIKIDKQIMPGTLLPPELLKTIFSYQEQWRLINQSRLVFIGKITQISRPQYGVYHYCCVNLPICIVEMPPNRYLFQKKYVLSCRVFSDCSYFGIQHHYGYRRGCGTELHTFSSNDHAKWMMVNYAYC